MKKLLLTTSIVLATISSAFALTDIADSDFKVYIENAQREHIISGYDDDTFRPNNPVSFVESLKIIINTGPQRQEIGKQTATMNFKYWHGPYVYFYNQNQKTNEVYFENNDKITRDFAVYLILKQLGITLDKTDFDKIPANKNFPDVNKYTALAPYIKFAKHVKITDGYSDGTFGPKNRVSRGELTKMVWRSLRENKEDILEKYSEFKKGNTLTKIEKTKPTPIQPTEETDYRVYYITDGDTLKVKKGNERHTLRILGMDSPELSTTRLGYAECYGKEAKIYLASLVPVDTPIQIQFFGGDKYKRDLASIKHNGQDIANAMIKNGYALVYRGGVKPNNYQELLQSEEYAKMNKLGLWSPSTCNGKRIPVKTNHKTPITQPSPKKPSQNSKYTIECSLGQIKGNVNSKNRKIYHLPSAPQYNRIKIRPNEGDKCFNTEDEAIKAGFRPSHSQNNKR